MQMEPKSEQQADTSSSNEEEEEKEEEDFRSESPPSPDYKNPHITIHAELESTDTAAVSTAKDSTATTPVKGNRQLPAQQSITPAAAKQKKKKKVSQKSIDTQAQALHEELKQGLTAAAALSKGKRQAN